MPYEVRKQGTGWQVVNSDTGKVHAKHTTRQKADAQLRLLNAQDHGIDVTRTTSDGTPVHINVKPKRRRRSGQAHP